MHGLDSFEQEEYEKAEQEKALREQRKKMIKDTQWSIDYHSEKLKEAELQLKLLIDTNPQ